MVEVEYIEIENLVDCIVDNRGKSVPTESVGIPLIATNCIKHSSIYPTFENIRFISQTTYNNWFRSHLKPYDILFVNKGTPGRVCIVPDPVNFVAAQDMVGLRFKRDYNPFYILAVLRSKEIQKNIENNHVGLVIPHFRKQELLKLRLPILGKEQRNYIGKLYSSISEKIELNNRINAELEAMAKTIYDYWFVQFDFPNAQGKPYNTSGGKMVWDKELKREVPEGWEVKRLSEITNTIMRGISPKYVEESGVCVLNQKCIRDNTISFEQSRRHDNKTKNADARFIQIGDILVNSTGFGTLGRVAMVKRLTEPQTTVDSHVTIVRGNSLIINNYFLGFNMLRRQSEIEGLAEGSTGQTELSRVKLGELRIVCPPQKLQNDFASKLKPLVQKMANNETENTHLSKLRDWLLPMLMNGQVKVGDFTKEPKAYKVHNDMNIAAEP